MAVINKVGNALTGSTGSGLFVGQTSPSLITPSLGVASITSINFGGGALSSYTPASTFSPAFTFATPGDLSVSYATQIGYYVRKGEKIYIFMIMVFTPTYTTSSGSARFTSLPITVSRNVTVQLMNITNTLTYQAGRTQIQGLATSTLIVLQGQGTGVSSSMTTAQFVSGAEYSLQLRGWYLA